MQSFNDNLLICYLSYNVHFITAWGVNSSRREKRKDYLNHFARYIDSHLKNSITKNFTHPNKYNDIQKTIHILFLILVATQLASVAPRVLSVQH